MKQFCAFLLSLLITIGAYAACDNDPAILQAKQSVVNIDVTVHQSAYKERTRLRGSGSLVDRERGLILTNAHVASPSSAVEYQVTFFGGREVQAHLYDYDIMHDYAILQVPPASIPPHVTPLPFTTQPPHMDEPVVIIGSNQGQSFSIQTGTISALYEDTLTKSGHFLRYSINSTGGSSGSPVLNCRGEFVGLNTASDQTYGFALPADYVADALASLRAGHPMTRQSLAIRTEYYSLDKAAKYMRFPQALLDSYIATYPEALNRALVVEGVMPYSPAKGKLSPGDIIWAVNKTPIGPSAYLLNKAINAAKGPITLTVIRQGETKDITLTPFNIADHAITRMVVLGGATFYESDDLIGLMSGVTPGTLMVSRIYPGASFHQKLPDTGTNGDMGFNSIQALDGAPVRTLDELIALIPRLQKKQHFIAHYTNQAYHLLSGDMLSFDKLHTYTDITLNELDPLPELLSYDPADKQWHSQSLSAPAEATPDAPPRR